MRGGSSHFVSEKFSTTPNEYLALGMSVTCAALRVVLPYKIYVHNLWFES